MKTTVLTLAGHKLLVSMRLQCKRQPDIQAEKPGHDQRRPEYKFVQQISKDCRAFTSRNGEVLEASEAKSSLL